MERHCRKGNESLEQQGGMGHGPGEVNVCGRPATPHRETAGNHIFQVDQVFVIYIFYQMLTTVVGIK